MNPLFDPCDTDCILDPFAEADEDTGETKQSQNYIHIRIQRKLWISFGGSSAIHSSQDGVANQDLSTQQNGMVVRH